MLAIVRQRRSKDVGRQNVLRNEQISRRLRGRSEIEQAMHDAEAKRAQELTNIDLPDLPTAEALLAAETEHVAAIDQLKAELRGLLAGETPSDDLARLRDVAANEAEQARHALAGMGDVGKDPQRALDRSSSAVRLGIAERERTLRESAEADGRVKANDVDAEQVAATAEQLAAARDRLLAAERRLRVTRGTLEALDRAVEGTMKKAARFLEKRMATDVARITGGRYRRIRVDENELTFSVWSMERSDWVDVRDLSQGTLDQFYLAARLGLVRQVTQGPPAADDLRRSVPDLRRWAGARGAPADARDRCRPAGHLSHDVRSLRRGRGLGHRPRGTDRPGCDGRRGRARFEHAQQRFRRHRTGRRRLNPLGIAFGLLSSVTWGAADFAAGLVTRTLGAFMTVALTQAVGLAGAATLVVLTGEPVPPPEALAWGLAAGVVGLVGASAFYRVLADGRMSIGSPLVAVIGAGLPVLVALLFGERLPPSDLAGIVLGLIAVVLVSMPARTGAQRDHGRLDRRLLALAILAGAGLAGFFLLVDRSAALGLARGGS